MITIGVLSDTHLLGPEKWFREKVDRCFADADMILHAGDLTRLSVLEVFAGKSLHAVHGNMCNPKTREALPATKIIRSYAQARVPPLRPHPDGEPGQLYRHINLCHNYC